MPDSIKAQIASIINEDGDGIVGITSLMNAAISNDIRSVEFFAKAGESAVNQKNVGGATALHIAARNGNIEICKILIENKADVNSEDKEGWTPLMRAALSKNSDLVRLLIDNGADASKTNSFGETVIINSASVGCVKCLEQLFSNYDFVENLDTDFLRKQIKDSILIAGNRNDLETASILNDYLDLEMTQEKTYKLSSRPSSQIPNSQPSDVSSEISPLIPMSDNGNKKMVMIRPLDDMKSGSDQFKKSNIHKVFIFKVGKTGVNQENHSTNKEIGLLDNKKNKVMPFSNQADQRKNNVVMSKIVYKFLGETKPFLPYKYQK